MDASSDGYRSGAAQGLQARADGADARAWAQGPGEAAAWPRPRARDASRLDRLYRLKLAGRDPERRRRRRRSLHELACWFALGLLLAAALASPVRAATPAAAGALAIG
ncbi:hypothetical protein SAMN04487939_102179 [Lysobacter sp. yr284]|uniref:hypothetical protein n=1 Tax=Lysobacter sp. yr284 TaxID=1761791 RepID=UPI00089AAA76|nr:hypothetical protein [Lysobacter sp. yr284]SDY44639.1 hypothetical protein SAMN04487939_102179 [Lysobacter sp. yr284]